jgi:hypothetical protein
MSPFDVEWPPPMLSDLADIWMKAPDRQAVTDASAEIDDLLSRDPLNHGVHLSEGLYRLRVVPLVVTFTINLAQRQVKINSVYTTP